MHWPLLHLRRGCAATAEQAQNGQGVHPKHPATQQGDDDGADANVATTHQAATSAPRVITAVFHIVGFAITFPFHI